VEAVLQSHPGVDECVVAVREGGPGERRLVGYVVGRKAPDAAELRSFLAARLPDPMVPGTFVALAGLPLTATGKVDRSALPAPGAEDRFVAPRTPGEAMLAEIWSELLEVERVGVHDNFFASGGDSILAIKLVSQLRRRGFDLPPREVFLHQTVAALAALLPAPADRRQDPGAAGDQMTEVGISQEELDDVLAEL
jgi:aryl carrier-like protein